MEDSPPQRLDLALHAQIQGLRSLALALVGVGEADDLLSKVFLKAVKRPPGPGVNIRSWLARSLRNAAIDWKRSESTRTARERRYEAMGTATLPDEAAIRREAEGNLRKSISELNSGAKWILESRYFEGRAVEEISRDLGISVGATRVRISRALGMLRERMEAKYGGAAPAYCLIVADPSLISPSLLRPLETKLQWQSILSGYPAIGLTLALATALFATLFETNSETSMGDALNIQTVAKMSAPGSFDDPKKAFARVPTSTHSSEHAVLLLDEFGLPVSNSDVYILGSSSEIRLSESEDSPGEYILSSSEKNAIEDNECFFVVSSLGHAPIIKKVPHWEGQLNIQLPELSVIQGKLLIENGGEIVQREVRLDTSTSVPGVGSTYYLWRSQLNEPQKDILDGAMSGFGAHLNPEGEFRFSGLKSGWQGWVHFHKGEFQVEGSEDHGAYQSVRLDGPGEGLIIKASPVPRVVGRIGCSDNRPGDGLPNGLELLNVSFPRSRIISSQIWLNGATGEFFAAFSELPDKGPIEFILRRGPFRGRALAEFSKGETCIIDIPSASLVAVEVADEEGNPIPSVEVSAFGGEVIGMTDGNGICQFSFPGFVTPPFNRVHLSHAGKIPVDIDVEKGRGLGILVEKSGVEISLIGTEDFPHGAVEIEIVCSQGLAPSDAPMDWRRAVQREWPEMCWEGDGGRLIKLATFAELGRPVEILGLRPLGEVFLVVKNNRTELLSISLREVDWNDFDRLIVNVPSPNSLERNGRILLPDGMAAKAAKVAWRDRKGDLQWLTSDQYGEFSLERIPVGVDFWAILKGYQISNIVAFGPSHQAGHGITLTLKDGRELNVGESHASCVIKKHEARLSVVRDHDRAEVKEEIWRGRPIVISDCPIEGFFLDAKFMEGVLRDFIGPSESKIRIPEFTNALFKFPLLSPEESIESVVVHSPDSSAANWIPTSYQVIKQEDGRHFLELIVPTGWETLSAKVESPSGHRDVVGKHVVGLPKLDRQKPNGQLNKKTLKE